MDNVTIGRQSDLETAKAWNGHIEHEDRSWIIRLDGNGKPALYHAERNASGGVIGDGVEL